MGACVEPRTAECQQDVDNESYFQSLLQSWWRNLSSFIDQKPQVSSLVVVPEPFEYSKPIEKVRKVRQELLNMSRKEEKKPINMSDLKQLEEYFDKSDGLARCRENKSRLSTYLKAVNKTIMEDIVEQKPARKKKKVDHKKEESQNRWWVNNRKQAPSRTATADMTTNLIQYLQTELQLMERYLSLHVKDSGFLRENVHVTLHISLKDIKALGNLSMIRSRRNQIKILCKQAILCLIEPSENAFVRFENNLVEVIENYRNLGCKQHFDIPREEDNFYWSVLVLSSWAKILLRQPNGALMQTIACALGCNTRRILVLSYSDDSEH